MIKRFTIIIIRLSVGTKMNSLSQKIIWEDSVNKKWPSSERIEPMLLKVFKIKKTSHRRPYGLVCMAYSWETTFDPGLGKHNCFSLDATNTPAKDTQTVDHCCVTVSTNQWIRIQAIVSVEHNSGQVLEVDLMIIDTLDHQNFACCFCLSSFRMYFLCFTKKN